MFFLMRSSPLRLSGVEPNRVEKSSSLIAAHSSGLMVRGSNNGSNEAELCGFAFLLYGQAFWHSSQPNIQPCRSMAELLSLSIVRHDMHRAVFMVIGSKIAPVGHLSMQRRHSPHPVVCKGVSYLSTSWLSTSSPNRTYEPYSGVRSSDCRPIHPRPASTAYCFSNNGAESTKARP